MHHSPHPVADKVGLSQSAGPILGMLEIGREREKGGPSDTAGMCSYVSLCVMGSDSV